MCFAMIENLQIAAGKARLWRDLRRDVVYE
jgi:hypothetical protein